MEDGAFSPFATVISEPAEIFFSPFKVTLAKLYVTSPDAAIALVKQPNVKRTVITPAKKDAKFLFFFMIETPFFNSHKFPLFFLENRSPISLDHYTFCHFDHFVLIHHSNNSECNVSLGICSATSFLRNWDSILEKKRANLRSISEPARLRQPPPQKHGSGTRKRAGSKHTGGATNSRPSRAFCPLVG